MAFFSRTTFTPILLTYDNEKMYLHIDSQGCVLLAENSLEPVFKLQEPLLLAHGTMSESSAIHLVFLKTNGELCYTLIPKSSAPQTTIIAKLDVRSTRYRRLFLFPQGNRIHIFYAYSHQAIRDLWRIEHRFWNGTSWNSVHLGEVVHPREPLYQVNLDRQGNLHLLIVTFQGRHSLLLTNRFNSTFHIWGTRAETMKISGEVMDMTALMTSDNVHHLFWAVKNPGGQLEVRWAQQVDAQELTSTWNPSPAPLKSLQPPFKGLGCLEINGVIWLLLHTEEENLLLNDGTGWKTVSAHTPYHRPIQWVHKGKRNSHQTYWLEDQAERHSPVYYQQLSITPYKGAPPSEPVTPLPLRATSPMPPTPPPVPAFHSEVSSATSYPISPVTNTPIVSSSLAGIDTINQVSPPPQKEISEVPSQSLLETSEALSSETIPTDPQSPSSEAMQEIPELPSSETEQEISESSHLEQLMMTIANLEEHNSNLTLVLESMLTKFEQILETISANSLTAKQDNKLTQEVESSMELSDEKPPTKVFIIHENSEDELEPAEEELKPAEEELEPALEALSPNVQSEESPKGKRKGGFWSKWIT